MGNDEIKPIDDTFDNVVDSVISEDGSILPRKNADYSGVLKIGDVELNCFVTDDGERYISGRSITGAIGMKGRGQGMARISSNSTLKPYINKELALAISSPVEITNKGAIPTHGYKADTLADICDAILEARKNNQLKTEQEARYGQYAEILVRGFARVGITALVDEATGYQYVRDKQALHKILDKFLQDEKRKWSKTFPDEFWFKLIKIKGYPSYMALKRPAFVGHWVNDIVYNRLAPGIRAKLNEINPRIRETGRRKGTHTQHLTEDYGVPELKTHLDKTMVLMDASSNKAEFEKLLNKSMPKYGDTIQMDL